MAMYEYRPDLEMFKRKDNRGPALKFNIIEGRRIKSMYELGDKVPTIYSKIDFVNDVSITNLRTFVKNLEMGNIDLDGEYPAPREQIVDMTLSERIRNLEERVGELEKNECKCIDENKPILDRVKLWKTMF